LFCFQLVGRDWVPACAPNGVSIDRYDGRLSCR
jgi:hypothetical protein